MGAILGKELAARHETGEPDGCESAFEELKELTNMEVCHRQHSPILSPGSWTPINMTSQHPVQVALYQVASGQAL